MSIHSSFGYDDDDDDEGKMNERAIYIIYKYTSKITFFSLESLFFLIEQ